MNERARILDIAMNLNRIGNWAADGFEERQKRIDLFLKQTSEYIDSLTPSSFPEPFKETFDQFAEEFKRLRDEASPRPSNELRWAEKMMTWGNILTHRAKLLS